MAIVRGTKQFVQIGNTAGMVFHHRGSVFKDGLFCVRQEAKFELPSGAKPKQEDKTCFWAC